MYRLFLFAAASLAWTMPALAAWHEAKSKHFIIYSDDSPERLRAYAVKLEKFDRAVRVARSMQDYPVGDGNRLTVFVVKDEKTVRQLANDKSGFLSGFYIGRASGPLAFVPRKQEDSSKPDLIFFHEYAHHLMMQALDRPYPEWLVEGFAEFLSTAEFKRDGSVILGTAAHHRAYGLFEGQSLPLEQLLSGNYSKLTSEQRESIYGRGWLLTHYLTFEPSRRGQLDAYLKGMASGQEPLAAATAAFGDLKKLDRDLNAYLNRQRIGGIGISGAAIPEPAVEIKPLSPGAAAVIVLRARSKRGVSEKTAEPLAAEVRQVQQAYPGDPLVEVTLAEAELDAGHAKASEAAADRALAADPRSTEAMIYKGRALMARATEGDSVDEKLVEQARNWFLKANKLDTEDPEPLMEYYNSFIAAGSRPTANAIAALHYASNLAPQDASLRINSGLQYLRDGDLKKARHTLAPIAYDPHGGGAAAIAREIVAKIASGDSAGLERIVYGNAKNETIGPD
ncbi:MAG: hypothetical protein ACLGHC_09605 [Alphaproteobacteria bacterium]